MTFLFIMIGVVATVGTVMERVPADRWDRVRLYRRLAAWLAARADAEEERRRVFRQKHQEYLKAVELL